LNWHRSYDDGLWLGDGTQDVGKIRRLHSHPWIVDPFNDDGSNELIDEDTGLKDDPVKVLKWLYTSDMTDF
jgi:hypothetical protein